MDSNLAFLGIAKKAGFLAVGEDSVAEAARNRKCRAVISAADASEPSKRRARRAARESAARHAELQCTKSELGAALGRGVTGIIAITDGGFAEAFIARVTSSDARGSPERRIRVNDERRRAQ
jgi:ribosomal protein L7Ae-like RNA K-turn-binding protein